MDPIKIDVSVIARDLKIAPQQVESALALLDAGNTIPFITRFRKDETGGLHEDQILAIRNQANQLRALGERKTFVLKSIDAQGELTDSLKGLIDKATTSRDLEELYQPFKTRKQSRASLARQQGLAPLAEDILENTSPELDLATRATDFVRVDKGLNSVDDVIKGVSDLIAESYSENESLRQELRQLVRATGKLTSHQIEQAVGSADKAPEQPGEASDSVNATPAQQNSSADQETGNSPEQSETPPTSDPAPAAESDSETQSQKHTQTESITTAPSVNSPAVGSPVVGQTTDETADAATSQPEPGSNDTPQTSVDSAVAETSTSNEPEQPTSNATEQQRSEVTSAPQAAGQNPEPTNDSDTQPSAAETKPKKKKKRKKKKKSPDPFKDFHDFEQPLGKLAHHQILAINRGERAGKLRVKVKFDQEKVHQLAFEKLVPSGHPSEEFLKKCAVDSLTRSILPSIEREIRRELTEAAESHAVEVFARNLKNLLLQSPNRNRVVLAIDPGFKRGCTAAILDPFGRLIDSGHLFVVGNQQRRDDSRQRISDWIVQHKVDLIAIGNGTGCRQVEQMVSDALAAIKDQRQAQYIIINEAGTSNYSTSEIGREELPDQSPAVRSAISIGRRLQDPLSELVKTAPANIGVGMYQHDIKSKHLADSLDEVVQSCVNRVGVDINTASASLLKHVSGLNALTARRMIEYRDQHGRFNRREEIKNVNGVGDATYVQAAGFLRIHGGEDALDATSIHPESYPIAKDILEQVEATVDDIFPRWLMQPRKEESVATEPLEQKPEPQTDQASADETPEASTAVTDNDSESPAVDDNPVTQEDAPVVDQSATTEAGEPSADADSDDQDQSSDDHRMTRREFDQQRKAIVKRMADLNIDEIAKRHGCGRLLVKDVLLSLKRPAWDPRDKSHKPLFRSGIVKIEDLQKDMELSAEIVNVVDFGVFVDIGLGESSLVHVSQLSNHYIADPHQNFSVGDVIKVWVTEIESNRRRVKLTAVRPGTSKPARRRPKKSRDGGAQPKAPRGSGDRKPGKYERRGGKSPRSGGGGHSKRRSRPAPKPRPITDEMLSGDAPMKSFSDLMQFVNKRSDPKSKSDQESEKKSD